MACATRALGFPVGQTKLAKLAGTDVVHSTDEVGIKRALLACGFVPEAFSGNISLSAKNWLAVKLRLGYPVILCVGKLRWEHWVCAVGMLGNRYLVFDPARYEYRVHSGVQFYTWKRLAELWYASRAVRGTEGAYYGVAVLTT